MKEKTFLVESSDSLTSNFHFRFSLTLVWNANRFFCVIENARKSFNQIKCENVFKAYANRKKENVMRFHWQWLWHAMLRILCLFLAIPALNTFFARCENEQKSESQVHRESLLGTLVDFIWISCTFFFSFAITSKHNFHFHSFHFNEHTPAMRERWRKMVYEGKIKSRERMS